MSNSKRGIINLLKKSDPTPKKLSTGTQMPSDPRRECKNYLESADTRNLIGAYNAIGDNADLPFDAAYQIVCRIFGSFLGSGVSNSCSIYDAATLPLSYPIIFNAFIIVVKNFKDCLRNDTAKFNSLGGTPIFENVQTCFIALADWVEVDSADKNLITIINEAFQKGAEESSHPMLEHIATYKKYAEKKASQRVQILAYCH